MVFQIGIGIAIAISISKEDRDRDRDRDFGDRGHALMAARWSSSFLTHFTLAKMPPKSLTLALEGIS